MPDALIAPSASHSPLFHAFAWQSFGQLPCGIHFGSDAVQLTVTPVPLWEARCIAFKAIADHADHAEHCLVGFTEVQS